MRKLFFILILFTSCTPEARLKRLHKKYPELFVKDTIFIRDTLITSEVSKDSAFYFYQKDTVLIKEGKLEIRYILNKDSTVYIQGKCLPDTIIKTIPVITEKAIINEKSWYDRFVNWLIPIILILFIFTTIKGARKNN